MKFSVVTATFNAAQHLPTLVASLRNQTDRDFEWVVVDGGSTDSTVELLRGLSDLRVVWVSEPDFGIYDALNKAVRMASGEYYLVCGADDVLSPTALQDYKQITMGTSADVVSACLDSDHGLIRPLRGQPWRNGHAAYVSHHSVGTVFRRSLHERFGYYSRRFPIAADVYFIKQVCGSPDTRFVTADFVAGRYAVGGVSATDVPGSMTEFFRIQLETERYPGVQLLLFVVRILRSWSRIVRYAVTRRE